ncbi:hypothetical protein GCM10009750_04670 [Agromyces salentinus]|uniref:Signal transduction histidine kinase subgroup 3 dimerisation and phosphoacceptor domain-containing protein n=1 Tax=Agromyces salentinus TaxID=269421 RepID=A0ABN2MG84_9MICO|nr:hypothetical protein [Agromyces salentinus]
MLRHAPGATTVVIVRRAPGPGAGLDVTVRNEAAPDASAGTPAEQVRAGASGSVAASGATASGATAGAGADAGRPGQAGHGLIGIRERARLLGGSIESGETPDGGFEVHAVLPLADDREAAR